MACAGELELDSAREGRATRLRVRAQPGARRRGVLGTWNGHLKVGLQSPPEGGRANEELARLLAELLGLRQDQVRLLRGERSRSKLFELDLAPGPVRARLLGLFGSER